MLSIRLRGVLVMLRVLFPFLLIGALWLATRAATADLREATDAYRAQVDVRVENIRADFREASEGLATLGDYATGVRDAVEAQAEAISSLTSELRVPLPTVPIVNYNIPDINVPIPGVAQLKALSADLSAAGAALGAEVSKVTEVAQVPAEVRGIVDESAAYGRELGSVALRWVRTILLLLVLAAAVVIAAWGAALLAELLRGWRMLTTGREQLAGLRGLEARVRALEAQLART